MTSLEPVYEEIFKSWYSDLEEVKGLERYTKVIDGVDGNKITLYIHKPKNLESSVPGDSSYTRWWYGHYIEARNPNYKKMEDDLAATGLVVVGVEFRNVAGELECIFLLV